MGTALGFGIGLVRSISDAGGSEPTGLWILIDGTWDSLGEWDDAASWNDGA